MTLLMNGARPMIRCHLMHGAGSTSGAREESDNAAEASMVPGWSRMNA